MKKEFDQGRLHPPVHLLHPQSAGAAIWAKGLLNRLRVQAVVLQQAYYLQEFAPEARSEVTNEYNQVAGSLEEYIKKVFNEWLAAVEENALARLNIPLLLRNDDFLENNFDRALER